MACKSMSWQVMKVSAALKASGKDVINWHIGRPDFDTPLHIKEACWKALREGHVHYAPAAGLWELREALAERAEEVQSLLLLLFAALGCASSSVFRGERRSMGAPWSPSAWWSATVGWKQ